MIEWEIMLQRKYETYIRASEQDLFDAWRQKITQQGKVFIPDGVVNTDQWVQAKRKILFLLKEVNGGEQEWDERDYLRYYNSEPQYLKTHSLTISALIQWIHAVNADEFVGWDEVLSATQEPDVQSALLEQIALVNVKKTPGAGTVDGEKFEEYWQDVENQAYLKQQLELYLCSAVPPDYIICGTTAWYFGKLFQEEKLSWSITTRGIPYCKYNDSFIIDFCHPQARISSNIKYYALYYAIREIESSR